MRLVGGQEGVLFECPKCQFATLGASRYSCVQCNVHLCTGCAVPGVESNSAGEGGDLRIPQKVQGMTVRGEGGVMVSAGASQAINMHQL